MKDEPTEKDEPAEIAGQAIKRLDLSSEIEQKLIDIQAEVAAATREHFIEMVQAIRQQASALDRIQATLAILVNAVAPKIVEEVPPAIRVVANGERPDLASAVVVADPIGQGYSLSQANIAKALGLNSADVSELAKAFKIEKLDGCAVVVRDGHRNRIVNYHQRAIQKFLDLLKDPPPGLKPAERAVVDRARRKLQKKP